MERNPRPARDVLAGFLMAASSGGLLGGAFLLFDVYRVKQDLMPLLLLRIAATAVVALFEEFLFQGFPRSCCEVIWPMAIRNLPSRSFSPACIFETWQADRFRCGVVEWSGANPAGFRCGAAVQVLGSRICVLVHCGNDPRLCPIAHTFAVAVNWAACRSGFSVSKGCNGWRNTGCNRLKPYYLGSVRTSLAALFRSVCCR